MDVPVTATAEVALPGVSAGQRVWVDGTARTAGPLADGDGSTGQAGVAVVSVSSGWHQVSTAP